MSKWFVTFINGLKNDVKGSITIIVTLAFLGLATLASLAINYQNVVRYEARVKSAADAAVIAAVKHNGSLQQKRAEGLRVFEANLALIGPDSAAEIAFNPRVDGGFDASVSGKTPIFLGGLFGRSQWEIAFSISAVRSIPGKLELALALDTTYSMTGVRIATLKKAATDLVETLSKAALFKGQIKISIIPFDVYVNVGTTYRNAPWLDVPREAVTKSTVVCPATVDVSRFTGCRVEKTPATVAQPDYPCTNDGVRTICRGAPGQPARELRVCDYKEGTKIDSLCYISAGYAYAKWEGCVGSRSYPFDTEDGNFYHKIPGLNSGAGLLSCGSPILPLTDNFSIVKDKLNSLTPLGETYTPAGLLWAWYSLTPNEPLVAQSNTKADPVMKYIVLMTDGANTGVPAYPKHNGNPSRLNETSKIFREICKNISEDKTNSITVSTIGFQLTDNASKALLRECALKNNGIYFDSTDASKLIEAFEQIVNSLIQVRLIK